MDGQTTNLQEVANNEGDESQGGYKILIVDDDMWIQRIFSKYLVEWGFKPISAYDPFEGVAMAVKHKPLIIFLDIVMPEVQGVVLLKMLKAIEVTADIPVNIISSNFSKELLSETYKHGAIGFMSKPFTQKIIYSTIKKSLSEELVAELEAKSFNIIL